jgi:hypothetical protein
VQVLTAQAQLVNTLEQVLITINGLKISVAQLQFNGTHVKSELTLRSLCPACLKLAQLQNLLSNSMWIFWPKLFFHSRPIL